MKTIFVVEGQTGEYSDHCEWPVKAFVSETKAKRLVVEAQARANEIYAKGYYGIPKDAINEFDPNMQTDYTGTRYSYYHIELDETI